MSKQLHTPGTWSVELDVTDSIDVAVFSDSAETVPGKLLAIVDHRDHPDDTDEPSREEAIANAYLMASAPDLRDGCNALIGLIQLVCGRSDMPPAIKKALLCSHRMDEALAALIKSERRPQPPHRRSPMK